jgi:hypothetical protein
MCNVDFYNLYSPNIIRTIRSRRVRFVGHVAYMGKIRNTFKILVRKPDGKTYTQMGRYC